MNIHRILGCLIITVAVVASAQTEKILWINGSMELVNLDHLRWVHLLNVFIIGFALLLWKRKPRFFSRRRRA